MSLYCQYCHRLFSRVDSRVRHEKHSCQSSGSEKAREVPKITFPNEKNHGILNGIEMGEAFRLKTPSSIMIVGPSGCGKTCFTESLLLDHLEELFVNPPPTIHYCYGAWQDGFQDMKFHEGVPTTFHLQKWFPKGGLLVLDDLMVEGGEDKELLDLFTKHSHHQNITVLYLCQDMFPLGKYAKCISRNAHYIVAFKNLRDQLARDEEFTASSFSHLLARHDGRESNAAWVNNRMLFSSRELSWRSDLWPGDRSHA